MKLALALLLLAAPLSAQTPTTPKIVVNVVVTLVRSGGSTGSPTPVPVTPPVTTPPPGPPTPVTPTPTPVTPTPVTSNPTPGCVNNYPAAAKSMADVTTDLVQAQQIYATALSSNAISAAAYATGVKTLSLVNVDNSDVRDLIRIGGPPSVIAQNITFVSAEIGTLPGLLGTTSQLQSSLSTLTTAMQASLSTASTEVTQSTCPQAVP